MLIIFNATVIIALVVVCSLTQCPRISVFWYNELKTLKLLPVCGILIHLTVYLLVHMWKAFFSRCFSKRQKILYVVLCFQKIENSAYFCYCAVILSITSDVDLCWLPKSEMDISGAPHWI